MKRILAAFLSAGLVLSLASCNIEPSQTTTADTSDTIDTSTTSTSQTTRGTSESSSSLLETTYPPATLPIWTGTTSDTQTTQQTTQSETTSSETTQSETTTKPEPPAIVETEVFSFESNGDGTCTLISLRKKELTSFEIPSVSPLGERVTAIGERAFSFSKAKEVVIPEGIRELGDYAFQFSELTRITLPTTLEKIGAFSFQSTPLTGIIIPKGTREIGECAFKDCRKLTYISLAETVMTIGENAFLNVPNDACTLYEGAYYLGCYDNPHHMMRALADKTVTTVKVHEDTNLFCVGIFDDSENFEEITLPSGMTRVQKGVFSGTALRRITFGSGIKEIEDGAFAGCDSLVKITIPKTVERIGDLAFQNCDSLAHVTIEEGVREIGDQAFYDCEALSVVRLPSTLESIGERAFHRAWLLHIFYYAGTMEAWDSVEKGMQWEELMGHHTKGTVFNGDYSVFCSDGEIFVAREGLGMFDEEVTKRPSSDIVASEQLVFRSNGDGTCFVLHTMDPEASIIEIPEKSPAGDTVVAIGKSAFAGASASRILLPSTIREIGVRAFDGVSAEALTSFSGGYYLATADNPHFAMVDKETSSRYTIHENTVVLIDYLFADHREFYDIDEIVIPDSVKRIPEGAFRSGHILKIVIGGGVESIGKDAFSNLALKEIVIPGNVKVIESEAFRGISQLHRITLEEGVEIVEKRAFMWHDDAMSTVILPSSLRRIGEHGFSNSGFMTQIAYKGAMAQWEKIELVKDSLYSAGGYQILCTDGTIRP